MSPRVRTLAHGIESLIDTVSDAIQAPLYVRYTLYLVYSPMTSKENTQVILQCNDISTVTSCSEISNLFTG
jgi:hypothetical protein